MNITDLTIQQAAPLLATRELSPVELTQGCIEQVSQLDEQLRCFIQPTFEQAIQEARKAEKDIATGNYRGPLHGIPLALKDVFIAQGTRTTAGSPINIATPDMDSTVNQKRRLSCHRA